MARLIGVFVDADPRVKANYGGWFVEITPWLKLLREHGHRLVWVCPRRFPHPLQRGCYPAFRELFDAVLVDDRRDVDLLYLPCYTGGYARWVYTAVTDCLAARKIVVADESDGYMGLIERFGRARGFRVIARYQHAVAAQDAVYVPWPYHPDLEPACSVPPKTRDFIFLGNEYGRGVRIAPYLASISEFRPLVVGAWDGALRARLASAGVRFGKPDYRHRSSLIASARCTINVVRQRLRRLGLVPSRVPDSIALGTLVLSEAYGNVADFLPRRYVFGNPSEFYAMVKEIASLSEQEYRERIEECRRHIRKLASIERFEEAFLNCFR
ncbi:MAG TPA: hypothetical protein VJV74_15750 [Terriglobia bacterium]|nr:hypothetical protein [Terriglobia bacterium]